MMNIKFKNNKPKFANLGRRMKPKNAEIVVHPDGKELYLLDSPSDTAAIDSLLLASKFNKTKDDIKYLMFLYLEHILDTDEPDEKTFYMLMDEFNNWWKHIEENLGTE